MKIQHDVKCVRKINITSTPDWSTFVQKVLQRKEQKSITVLSLKTLVKVPIDVPHEKHIHITKTNSDITYIYIQECFFLPRHFYFLLHQGEVKQSLLAQIQIVSFPKSTSLNILSTKLCSLMCHPSKKVFSCHLA